MKTNSQFSIYLTIGILLTFSPQVLMRNVKGRTPVEPDMLTLRNHEKSSRESYNILRNEKRNADEDRAMPKEESESRAPRVEEAKRNTGRNATNKKEVNPNDGEHETGVSEYGYDNEKEVAPVQDKKTAKKLRDKTTELKKAKEERREHNKPNKPRARRKPNPEREYARSKSKKQSSEDFQLGGVGDMAGLKYEIDPVLNVLRTDDKMRRAAAQEDSSLSQSSSRELGNFKQQFRDLWLQKKYEALNFSNAPSGDQINMGGARPWGVKCGDPNQHDMPWGSCMLPIECEPEYRIYRGDMYCGRTSFVCCALELTTYDMYQGFDVSFEGKSLSTDTEEVVRDAKDEKKKKDTKKKRRKERSKRKSKIKKSIKNIVKEINKILNKMYNNATKHRKKKTKQLKRFIKFLKNEYKKNRHAVKGLHEQTMVKIDADLMKKLNDIKEMNHNFMKNQTFADIVVNGTMTKEGARMLIQAYPDLADFIDSNMPTPKPPANALAHLRAADVKTRRSESNGKNLLKANGQYLEYDVEYGFLYY